MILRATCQCGERISLYMTPGAMVRCWQCRRSVRIIGDDYEMAVRQEVTMQVAGRAPGYTKQDYVLMR